MTKIITRSLNEIKVAQTTSYITPEKTYQALNEEFHFDFDPCPFNQVPVFDGLNIEWGKCNFVNPPYGKEITFWIIKGLKEYLKGKTSVFLLPSYTDVRWFHDFVLPYSSEIRFIKGRLKFSNWPNRKGSEVAPFASMVVIFKP